MPLASGWRSTLVAKAVPAFGPNLGAANVTTLPDDWASKQISMTLQRSFAQARAEPAEIVIDGSRLPPPMRHRG